MNKKLKILCVCQGGNVRSVTLAYVLKYGYSCDALACGWQPNSDETKRMLFEWADRIIITDYDMEDKIPKKYKKKLSLYVIGPDRWFRSLHPELVNICANLISLDKNFQPKQEEVTA